jgi:hypothetical protein
MYAGVIRSDKGAGVGAAATAGLDPANVAVAVSRARAVVAKARVDEAVTLASR